MDFLLEPPSTECTYFDIPPPSSRKPTPAYASPSIPTPAPEPELIAFVLPEPVQHTADIVLKSCDAIEFRVHTTFLAAASPVFANMLLMPAPPSPPATAADPPRLPEVELSEPADVLALLLTCIYPVSRSRPSSLGLLGRVLRAAEKYDVSSALSTLRKDLIHPCFLSSDPLHVYALACVSGFHAEALLAARATLPLALPDLLAQKDALSAETGLLASDFVRLLSMRMRISAHMSSVLSTILLSPSLSPLARTQYSVPTCHRTHRVQPWVKFWVQDALLEIGRRPIVQGMFEYWAVGRAWDAVGGCGCCEDAGRWEGEGMRRLREAMEGHGVEFI